MRQVTEDGELAGMYEWGAGRKRIQPQRARRFRFLADLFNLRTVVPQGFSSVFAINSLRFQFLADLFPFGDAFLQVGAVLMEVAGNAPGFVGADEVQQRRLASGDIAFEL